MEERAALRDYLQGDALLGRFFEAFLFEDVPAVDRRADDVYLDEVARCDIYVALLGNQYGREDSAGLSATHQEFNEATRLGKTRLVFVKGADDTVRDEKMQGLIAEAGTQLVRRRFQSVPELTAFVYASLIKYLEQSGLIHNGPFDAASCSNATANDISPEKVAWFLQRAKNSRGYTLDEDTPMLEALTHLNLFNKGIPSHAAILLFGKIPQRFLITSEVKCMHFHGREMQKPIPSYQIYKGTVFDLVDQAIDFVMSKLNRTVGTRELGPEAPVEYEIPREVVAEGIVNAIAHRDYTSNASVQVMLFSDRLEIWNPGELRPPLSLDKLSRPHPSIPANPLIAEPLFLAKYIEKAGSGTLDIVTRCKSGGFRPPEFRLDAGCFILTIWRKAGLILEVTGQVTGQVEPWVLQVLEACVTPLKSSEIKELIGIRHRETFQRNYLDRLLTEGWLERTIPDRPKSSMQKYRVTEKGKGYLASIKNDKRA